MATLPRVGLFGFNQRTIGRILISFKDFPFQMYISSLNKVDQINEYLSEIDKTDIADFYIIDCLTLFREKHPGLRPRKQRDNAQKVDYSDKNAKLCKFINEDLYPLKNKFEQIAYNPDFIIYIFYSDTPTYKDWANQLIGAYIHKDHQVRGVPTLYRDTFALTVWELAHILKRITELKLLDVHKQKEILNQILAELQMADSQIPSGLTLVDPTLRIIDESSLIATFKERCKRFLFLYDLYRKNNGKANKIKRGDLRKLHTIYNQQSLEVDYMICSDKSPQTSRYDFQITHLFEKLCPNDADEFVTFLANLKEKTKPKCKTINKQKTSFHPL